MGSKLFQSLIALILTLAMLATCGLLTACKTPDPTPQPTQHICGHICDDCHKCTDVTCTDTMCIDKCNGHNDPQPEENLKHAGTAEDPYTVMEAITLCATPPTTPVYVKGVVSGQIILTKYDPKDKWQFDLVDATGDENKLMIYFAKSTSEPIEGQELVVKGWLTMYNTTPEIVKNNGVDPFIVSIDGNQTGLDKNNIVEPILPENTMAILKYTGNTTTNMGKSDSDEELLNLDAKIFTVTSSANYSDPTKGNKAGLNKDGTIRLYVGEKTSSNPDVFSSNGCTLTITVAEGYVIKNITVKAKAQKETVLMKIGDGEAITLEPTSSEEIVTVNGTSITIQNVNTTNVQLWIESIIISYESVE